MTMTGPNLPPLFDHTGPETGQGVNDSTDGHQAQDTDRAGKDIDESA